MSVITSFVDQISQVDQQINALQKEITILKKEFLKIEKDQAFQKNIEMGKEGAFENMPNEISEKILAYLPRNSLAACAQVNSKWNFLCREVFVYHQSKYLGFSIPRCLDMDTKYQLFSLKFRLEKCHFVSLKKIKEVKKYLDLCKKNAAISFMAMYVILVANLLTPDGVEFDPNDSMWGNW